MTSELPTLLPEKLRNDVHESARAHVTGEALYTDDMIGHFPGLLHAWPITAPHAHAVITGLNFHDAMKQPGVITTLAADDAPGEADSGANRHDEPLFPREVLYHSQPVAWVLGETLEAARLGAERVQVTYRKLPAILTIDAAISNNSFHSGPFQIARGDAAAAPHRPACIQEGCVFAIRVGGRLPTLV